MFSKRLFTGLLILPAWLLLIGSSLAKPVIKLEASPREVILGQSLQLQLTLLQEANEKGAMVDAPSLALPELPGFEVLGQQSSSSMISANNRLRMMVQAQYRLRPLKAGELVIPSLTFRYSENGQEQELSTQPLIIRVKGESGSAGLIWLLGGILVCGAGIWMLRRHRPGPLLAPVKSNQPPGSLEALEARLAQGESPRLLLEEPRVAKS